ncbi:dihydrofolate reductase family protein [Sphingomonadaceae bacterium OTU29THOMA1]|uniref:dihydrofolate reductase family protein n=1 Tax=Sphingomonas sp. Leaf37 TaxID=2876552 RepID=UPI001E379593|nr:dihydrofolate reductase family protein [Sphingomonas sp. Leaf37]USU04262.1 dihydrofolate reductase family protein [Sphingomonadaceae bacterium OTU29LAMAA1]USU13884.1 dihydrofolate reductase family protein [Sphingomonadaceae bacterium OTU29THOMA1]
MRKLTGAAFLSLDGVMQAPGGPTEDTTGRFDQGGWVFGIGDDVIDPVLGGLFDPPYALLLGRRTYDIFAAYWPFVDGNMAGMGEALTAAEKHVVTHGDQPLDWANSHRLSNIAAVGALKESDGPDLLIQGSSTLYPPLLAAGLIDELVLMTFPVVLGTGKRLFGDGTPPGALRLLDQQLGTKGVIVTRWAPAGQIPTVGHPHPVTSAAETERQRRIKEETW